MWKSKSQPPDEKSSLKQLSILSFLRALVRVEAVSLESFDVLMNTPPPLTESSKKLRVHFLSLDGSSIRPPIDRDLQSGIRQQHSIAALISAKDQVDAMTASSLPHIQSLLTFLTHLQESSEELTAPSVEYYNMVLLCASSISKEFSPTAVYTTVNLILHDVHILEERLLSGDSNDHSTTPLQLESRLAELVGQGIRYRLRVLFNPAPPRLCNLDLQYEHRSQAYSKVNQLITMKSKVAKMELGCAADDGFLSALISRALRRLHDYWGLDHLMSQEQVGPIPPSTFCSSPASLRALPTPLRSMGDDLVTQQDRDSILHDVEEATSFLRAVYAARFLHDLWTAPGVGDEIDRMGGWSQVTSYANTSWKYHLHQLCTADAHLVPLSNIESLLRRLDIHCQVLEPHVDQCVEALKTLAKNYQVYVPRKRKVTAHLNDITKYYVDAMSEVHALPHVQAVSQN
jgi:hypothetical protein